MINYLAKFLPNLSSITAPLRELLKDQTAWHWTQKHDEALREIKDLLTESSRGVLKYYDPAKPVKLQVDACKSGLGAVLLQDERPVAYASRALTDAECRYAQIEKELLAVVFGCERFHQYVYGKEITTETDHKPLVSIITKSLDQAPARLQRMLLRLQRYDVQLIFKPGKAMYATDTLSRAHLTTQTKDDEDLITCISSVTTSLPVSDHKLLKLQQETAKDTELSALTNIIVEGWPLHKDRVPLEVRQYWPVRDQLTVDNGLVMKGEEIIIPSSMRRDVLSKIHEGHLGIVRSKLRAKEAVYWPGMLNQIEDLVTSCNTCQELRDNNQKEPMIPHEIPSYPWQAVATDLFTWNNLNYLVIVDYYSRYWEISSLNSTTSASIVSKLKSTFARHGIPEVVKSDNGPQYSSAEFATSSPTYPQSNGLSEKTVNTAKSILEKAHRDGKDPYLAILENRNTPVDNFKSPAQLSMGRRLRSVLPCTTKQLLPETPNLNDVQDNLHKKQAAQKLFYDRTAKELEPLNSGDPVRIKKDKTWKPAVVLNAADTPRSYVVQTEDGGEYRRNRRHLLKDTSRTTTETPQESATAESPPIDDRPAKQSDSTNHYQTRSGRQVKPPDRYF